MALIGQSNTTGSYGSHYILRLYAQELSYSIQNNTSYVEFTLVLYFDGSSYYAYTNNTTYGNISSLSEITNGSIGSISFSSGVPKEIVLLKTYRTVAHAANGEGSVYASGYWNTNTSRMGEGSVSGTLPLTKIPRYPTSNQSVYSKTSTTVIMNWWSDSSIDWVWYSIDNGNSWNNAGGEVSPGNANGNYTIYNLQPNTTYNIKTRLRRSDSQLTADSATISVQTYSKTIPTIELSSKSINSITVSSSCNVAVSSTEYRIKEVNGEFGSYQPSNTFENLTPKTTYIIEVKKIGLESNEIGTATLQITTYDYAKLNSYPEFNLGDSETIQFSNETGSLSAAIYDNTGASIICSYRTITGTNYTFNFTDDELDKLYKLFTNSNDITVKLYIKTVSNNISYYDTKSTKVTLTGNQKTGYQNVNGIWRRVKRWVNVNGIWRRAIRWVNVNGIWKRCI